MKGKPTLLYKVLVVGVLVLFIGIGIQPAFAVTPTTDSNDDCNLCEKKVSKSQLTLLRNLLNWVEKYDTKLSILFKQYPEFNEKNQELSESISKLRDINNDLRITKAKYDKHNEMAKELDSKTKQVEKLQKSYDKNMDKQKDYESDYKTIINDMDNKRHEAKKFENDLNRNKELQVEIATLIKQEGVLRGTANNLKQHKNKLSKLQEKLKILTAEFKKTKTTNNA